MFCNEVYSSCTDESIAQSLILQMKAEDWDGVFIDVSDGVVIPDKTSACCRGVSNYIPCSRARVSHV